MSVDVPCEGESGGAAEQGVVSSSAAAQMTMDDDDLSGFDSTRSTPVEPASPVRRALAAPNSCPDMPIAEALRTLRSQLLDHGLPPTPPHEAEELRTLSRTTFRGKCWKVLLGGCDITCEEYVELVGRGPSTMHSKIAVDACRTFARDREFRSRVPPEKLARVLNVAVRQLGARLGEDAAVYVQGMNAICGILLLDLNEVDAASALVALRERFCPLFLCKTLDGVHAACALLDRALLALDPALSAHLLRHSLSAKIYAFPWILSLGSCFPPLHAAARVMDLLFAEGIHAIVLVAAARLLALRAPLLAASRPMQVLQRLPPLDADEMILSARALWPRLDPDLQARLRSHPVTTASPPVSLASPSARDELCFEGDVDGQGEGDADESL